MNSSGQRRYSILAFQIHNILSHKYHLTDNLHFGFEGKSWAEIGLYDNFDVICQEWVAMNFVCRLLLQWLKV
jgi:hypothetical protein